MRVVFILRIEELLRGAILETAAGVLDLDRHQLATVADVS